MEFKLFGTNNVFPGLVILIQVIFCGPKGNDCWDQGQDGEINSDYSGFGPSPFAVIGDTDIRDTVDIVDIVDIACFLRNKQKFFHYANSFSPCGGAGTRSP